MGEVTVCACGCGSPSPPRGGRFRRGHNNKGRPSKRYATMSVRHKSELVHRQRAERALGHPLPATAMVHHADGSKRVDAPLVICQDAAYHGLLHARMRVKAAGGNPNTDKLCSRCRQPKPFDQFSHTNQRRAYLGRVAYCRPCDADLHRARYARH